MVVIMHERFPGISAVTTHMTAIIPFRGVARVMLVKIYKHHNIYTHHKTDNRPLLLRHNICCHFLPLFMPCCAPTRSPVCQYGCSLGFHTICQQSIACHLAPATEPVSEQAPACYPLPGNAPSLWLTGPCGDSGAVHPHSWHKTSPPGTDANVISLCTQDISVPHTTAHMTAHGLGSHVSCYPSPWYLAPRHVHCLFRVPFTVHHKKVSFF